MGVDSIPSFSQPNMQQHFETMNAIFPQMETGTLQSFGSTMLLMHEMLSLIEKYFNAAGISKARFLILVHLFLNKDGGGTSISDIRKSYPISSASMTVVLDTLERENMVERVPNQKDRRKITVRITEKGEEFMLQFIPQHEQYVSAMTKNLSSEELTMLPQLLGKLILGAQDFMQSMEG